MSMHMQDKIIWRCYKCWCLLWYGLDKFVSGNRGEPMCLEITTGLVSVLSIFVCIRLAWYMVALKIKLSYILKLRMVELAMDICRQETVGCWIFYLGSFALFCGEESECLFLVFRGLHLLFPLFVCWNS